MGFKPMTSGSYNQHVNPVSYRFWSLTWFPFCFISPTYMITLKSTKDTPDGTENTVKTLCIWSQCPLLKSDNQKNKSKQKGTFKNYQKAWCLTELRPCACVPEGMGSNPTLGHYLWNFVSRLKCETNFSQWSSAHSGRAASDVWTVWCDLHVTCV